MGRLTLGFFSTLQLDTFQIVALRVPGGWSLLKLASTDIPEPFKLKE